MHIYIQIGARTVLLFYIYIVCVCVFECVEWIYKDQSSSLRYALQSFNLLNEKQNQITTIYLYQHFVVVVVVVLRDSVIAKQSSRRRHHHRKNIIYFMVLVR